MHIQGFYLIIITILSDLCVHLLIQKPHLNKL